MALTLGAGERISSRPSEAFRTTINVRYRSEPGIIRGSTRLAIIGNPAPGTGFTLRSSSNFHPLAAHSRGQIGPIPLLAGAIRLRRHTPSGTGGSERFR
jgi:hypothetical protein